MIATVPVGLFPWGVAVTPDGAFVYVTNAADNTVSIITTGSNTVVTTFPVGTKPLGVAFTPEGNFAYVVNATSNDVSVIATADNKLVAPVAVGNQPSAFGRFIVSAPIVPPPFGGFFQPVEDPPKVNTVKAGRAVPVKFTLGGDHGLNIFAYGYPQSQHIQCASAVPIGADRDRHSDGGQQRSAIRQRRRYLRLCVEDARGLVGHLPAAQCALDRRKQSHRAVSVQVGGTPWSLCEGSSCLSISSMARSDEAEAAGGGEKVRLPGDPQRT